MSLFAAPLGIGNVFWRQSVDICQSAAMAFFFNFKVQKRKLFCSFNDTASCVKHFPFTSSFRKVQKYENSRQYEREMIFTKVKNTRLLSKKKKNVGRFLSHSLDNRRSNKKVLSFYFCHGKTRHDPDFCALFCYKSSPFYEKVESPEPLSDCPESLSVMCPFNK